MALRDSLYEVEEDPFDTTDMDQFYKDIMTTYHTLDKMEYFTSSVKLILSILVVVADICLIIVISKNSKLKTKTNAYILHYCIWHLEYMTTFQIIFTFISLFNIARYVPDWMFNIFFDSERMGLRLVFLFGFGLGIDWFLNVYNPQLGERYKTFNAWTLQILYIIGIIQGIMEYILSIFNYWMLQYWSTQITYYITLTTVLVFNWMDKRKKPTANQNSYALVISTIILGVWIPLEIYDQLMNITYGSYTLYSIVLYTLFLAEWVAYSPTIIIALMLVKMNKYFEMGFLRMFKRRVNKYQDEDQLDETEDDDNDVQNGTTVQNNSVYI